jgi:hypothetical protein
MTGLVSSGDGVAGLVVEGRKRGSEAIQTEHPWQIEPTHPN